jgi:hypothetical protein
MMMDEFLLLNVAEQHRQLNRVIEAAKSDL